MGEAPETSEAEVLLMNDLRVRAESAAQAWHEGASVAKIRPLTGGASSLTFVAELQNAPVDRVVLKVAPPGLPPLRNRDVLRQGKLMRALHGQPGVVVPPVYFSGEATSLENPPFVAMGFVLGDCFEPVLSERQPRRFQEIRSHALDMARVLAGIHRVRPEAVGLADESVITLTDEIDRWTRAFETLPQDLQGEYLRCADKLHATMPAAVEPVINHGDYRLGNTLGHEGKTTAVIDWEIWSLGDPRVDLTWMTFFTDEARHPAAPNNEPSGMPTSAELLNAYLDAGGVSFNDLQWFDALTRYKEAGATALLIKRGRKLGNLTPAMSRLIPTLQPMLTEAEQLLAEYL
jgi:aminoglycoside phosphotransferase (APT) family kinase protein